MLGVLAIGTETGAAFAPSIPAALLPVGEGSAVDRAIDAMIAVGVDEIHVDPADHELSVRVHERYPSVPIVQDDDLTGALVRHDRVLWMPATAVVDHSSLERLATAGAGVLKRPSEPFSPLAGPEPRPICLPADVFEDRAPSDAPAIARGLDVDGALERIECDHVADVRRPWELLDANEWYIAGVDTPDGHSIDGVRSRSDGEIHPDADLTGPVAVHQGARIGPGVVIEGPVVVSPGADVGPNCYVRSNTFIGEDVHIGASVEIKNSVLLDGAKVPHLSYVGDSVVGPDANVGAGSLVANLRHDDQPVRLTHNDCRVSTGRRKFGVVIGEGSKLGIGTRLNVGTVLGVGATTTPGEIVVRDVRTEGDTER
ncbi:hypothetical protein [Halobaculum limi]|uniref:hypothetical protein n=1 Tax=Halobaculum limi TaxID=3031916 RepID=UPI00240764B6|nr:hypothetical protein [Halobaculum sp. YSMS11]